MCFIRWSFNGLLLGLTLFSWGCRDLTSAPSRIVGNPVRTPTVTLNTPAAGSSQLSGHANNVDASKIKVVIYVLTNKWWIQPYDSAPYTDIRNDGFWTSYTHPWDHIVVLLVKPSSFPAAPTLTTHPSLEKGVIAWTDYPSSVDRLEDVLNKL